LLIFNIFFPDIIKEQNRELRGTQRAITRDRAALEKQEKQLVSRAGNFISLFKNTTPQYNRKPCKVLKIQLNA